MRVFLTVALFGVAMGMPDPTTTPLNEVSSNVATKCV